MYAIEFQANIKNGSIEIPEKYRRRLKEEGSDNAVRVIILAPERQLSGDFIDQLLDNPITAAGFVPFTRENCMSETEAAVNPFAIPASSSR